MEGAEDSYRGQKLLRLAGYYRKFMEGYARMSSPLTNLTKKDTQLIWDEECEEVFWYLKQALVDAPMLSLPTPGEKFHVFTNASGTGLG